MYKYQGLVHHSVQQWIDVKGQQHGFGHWSITIQDEGVKNKMQICHILAVGTGCKQNNLTEAFFICQLSSAVV